MASRYAILIILHSWAHPAMVGVQMVVMLLLLAINIKPCSLTCLIVPIKTSYDDVTSYRTRIDDDGQKYQHYHLLDPAGRMCPQLPAVMAERRHV